MTTSQSEDPLKQIKAQRLSSVARKIFGEAKTSGSDSLDDAFKAAIEAFYLHQKALGNLYKRDKKLYNKSMNGDEIDTLPKNLSSLKLALTSMVLARTFSKKVEDLAKNSGSRRALRTLRNFQEYHKKSIGTLNDSKYALSNSSPTSEQGRRQQGKMRQP